MGGQVNENSDFMQVPGLQPQGVNEDPFMGAAANGMNFGVQGQQESDLTEEEVEQIRKVEEANQERKRALFQKQEQEAEEKRARKQTAEETLAGMKGNRQKQIEQRRRTNTENEAAFFALREEQRKGNNPWERVNENCDFSTSSSAAGKDMSRMKQVMQARKTDITKAGGLKAKNTMDMF